MSGTTHIIRSDDTIQKLAAIHYGRWELWRLIFDNPANVHLQCREDLPPECSGWEDLPEGVSIWIPDPVTDSTTHVVQEGDKWESLSELYYGTEHFSRLIRSENGGAIIYDSIGSTVTIPALISKIEWSAIQRRRSGL